MKARLMKVRTWSSYGALLASLSYSVLALTSSPAYASSCNPCDPAPADLYCWDNFGGPARWFDCNEEFIVFVCFGDPTGTPHELPC